LQRSVKMPGAGCSASQRFHPLCTVSELQPSGKSTMAISPSRRCDEQYVTERG
jgi:hypothetical protein